jgi:hypothetical protein
MGRFLIYALHDPRSGELRYIGKSSNGLQRPRSHVYPNENRQRSHRAHWIKALLAEGLRPEIVVLEEYENGDGLAEMEQLAIAHYRSMGFRLTNQTAGGEGAPGMIHSAETRAKMSASKKGKPAPPRSAEHIAKIAAWNRSRIGKRLSDETRANMRAAHTGLKHSPEHCAAIRRGQVGVHHDNKHWIGRHHTPETKAKLSAHFKGRPRKLVAPAETKERFASSMRARRTLKAWLGHYVKPLPF